MTDVYNIAKWEKYLSLKNIYIDKAAKLDEITVPIKKHIILIILYLLNYFEIDKAWYNMYRDTINFLPSRSIRFVIV